MPNSHCPACGPKQCLLGILRLCQRINHTYAMIVICPFSTSWYYTALIQSQARVGHIENLGIELDILAPYTLDIIGATSS
jgi:hypothetical protein